MIRIKNSELQNLKIWTKKIRKLKSIYGLRIVAKTGIEPVTSGL